VWGVRGLDGVVYVFWCFTTLAEVIISGWQEVLNGHSVVDVRQGPFHKHI